MTSRAAVWVAPVALTRCLSVEAVAVVSPSMAYQFEVSVVMVGLEVQVEVVPP